ncbi:DNA-binding protein [Marinobacter halotolerans]|uniref:DNA-binding protein n=1 Tax=Marinobacter halotolerans TaxID=1569211 RepID=UPI001246952F|nr:DNA-binding protein [Marinobacter halotolerans]
MRKAKFSKEAIIAAGKTLQSQGSDVSPNAIKLELGGGNPTRIKKVWDEYVGTAESSDSGKSKLESRINPDNDLAFQIDIPVRRAAFEVETVFESLLHDLTDKIPEKLDDLVDVETSKLSFKVGELKSKLKFANEDLAQVKRYRAEEQRLLMEKTKENAELKDAVDHLTRQLKTLQEKQLG